MTLKSKYFAHKFAKSRFWLFPIGNPPMSAGLVEVEVLRFDVTVAPLKTAMFASLVVSPPETHKPAEGILSMTSRCK